MPLGALATFLTGTYTVTRPGAGAYTAGRWVPGAPTQFTADASIQPLSGRDLQILPEGFTIDGTRKMYTTTEVRAGGNAAESDKVTIGSETWRVVNVQYFEGWESNGHYKATIAKVDAL